MYFCYLSLNEFKVQNMSDTKQYIYHWGFLLILLSLLSSFQQRDTTDLKERWENKVKLYNTDPDKAYQSGQFLLEEAIRSKDFETELSIYAMHCWYFNRKLDISNLINSAKILRDKAKEYKHNRYLAIAHIFFSQAYVQNKLYDKALSEYEEAVKILEKENQNDPKISATIASAHTYISNLYIQRKDYEKAIEKLKLAEKEYLKIKDPNKQKTQLRINYANTASCFLEINIDSTEFYINKSIEFNVDHQDFTTYLNYKVLGDVFRKRNDFEKALVNYKLAEDSDHSDPVNVELLYKAFIEIYEANADKANVQKYTDKLKDIQLSISNKKYDSMHQILEDKETPATSIYTILIAAGLTLATVFVFIIIKNRSKQMAIASANDIPDEKKQEFNEQNYKMLIDLAWNNTPAFMPMFNDIFPDFSEKLLQVNPGLAQTEIEFSAYLRLNFSSKEIAQIKHIQPRTVQNRKHRLRKRLNIPQNLDIYHWFNTEL